MFNEVFSYIKGQIRTLDIFKVVYDDLSYIKKLARRFADCEKILVFGIGGSSLGGKCLVNFQAMTSGNSVDDARVVFIENVDSRHFLNIINKCNPEKTGIVVISKSGRTTETLMLFLTLCEMWKDFDYAHDAIAITEPSANNDLRTLADAKSMEVIEHNPKIGGRFSVFSVVGLLPALLGNVDIDAFVAAARKVLDDVFDRKVASECRVFSDACAMYDAFKSGDINQHVIMPYSDMLEYYGKWVVQLISESLGKSRDFAITPIRAVGTVDQHSMLQLFLDGTRNKFYTVMLAKHNDITPAISYRGVSHLYRHNINELMYANAKATIQVLQRTAPVRVLEFERLDVSVLGELMMQNFIETIVIAKLANINPFNQPAVEESKKLAMGYLEAWN